MKKATIIIADKDGDYRNSLAGHLRQQGYQVETSGSLARLVQSLLEKRSAVLLLSGDLEPRIAPADLVQLVKKCHRQLPVILISDELPLPALRQIRAEGVFYHALRPTGDDLEEVSLAVAAACTSCLSAASAADGTAPVAGLDRAAARPVLAGLAAKLPLFIGLVALFAGAGYLAAALMHERISAAICLFAIFAAAIVVHQLLPIFKIKLPAHLRARGAQKERASLHGK
jgi:hypothetical protein